MRLLFDTNVLMAAFIADGTCAELYRRAVLRNAVSVPRSVLAELREKLSEKTRLTTAEIDAIDRNIRREAHLLDDPPPLPASVCRDPDDDILLAAISVSRPAALVTGDNDLLVIGQFEGVPILRPREALDQFFPSR